jgi:hypothetical protein
MLGVHSNYGTKHTTADPFPFNAAIAVHLQTGLIHFGNRHVHDHRVALPARVGSRLEIGFLYDAQRHALVLFDSQNQPLTMHTTDMLRLQEPARPASVQPACLALFPLQPPLGIQICVRACDFTLALSPPMHATPAMVAASRALTPVPLRPVGAAHLSVQLVRSRVVVVAAPSSSTPVAEAVAVLERLSGEAGAGLRLLTAAGGGVPMQTTVARLAEHLERGEVLQGEMQW